MRQRPPSLPFHDGADAAGAAVSVAPAHVWVRESVARRLASADELLPSGIRLLVVEGLRPLTAQTAIHEAYQRALSAEQPELSAREIARLASRFVAPPAIAPHVSGAAVDLTLIGAGGDELDLGTPIDATPEQSDGACYFGATNINADARRHRRILAQALESVGLVNYPTEWWHWSYGDRYWAHASGQHHAVHGPLGAPATTDSAVAES